jgi:hypothetical protein
MVIGALIAAAGSTGSRTPGSSYLSDLLPGMLVLSVSIGAVFVGVTTAAKPGVPADKAGLAAALLNASQQVGGALGLAIFSRGRQVPTAARRSPRASTTDGFRGAARRQRLIRLRGRCRRNTTRRADEG